MVLIHRQWAATKGYATLWIAGFGLSVALMLVAAMAAWTFATERAGRFDDMIKNSPARLSVPAWMDRFMNLRRQLILPVLGAISGPIYLYFLRGALEHDVGIAFPSYVLVSWVSFVGGVDVYWLWVATGLPKEDLSMRRSRFALARSQFNTGPQAAVGQLRHIWTLPSRGPYQYKCSWIHSAEANYHERECYPIHTFRILRYCIYY